MACSGRTINSAKGSAGLLLPSAHSVGRPFVEITRSHSCLYSGAAHVLSNWVSHAHEGEADTPLLQFADKPEKLGASGNVEKVDRTAVEKHPLHVRRCGDRGSQPRTDVANAREKKVA